MLSTLDLGLQGIRRVIFPHRDVQCLDSANGFHLISHISHISLISQATPGGKTPVQRLLRTPSGA